MKCLKNIIWEENNLLSTKIVHSSLKTSSLFISIIAVIVIGTIVSLVALYPSMTKDNSYAELLQVMPQEMLDAIGMTGDVTNLNDYLNMNFYNSVYLYVLMTFTIVFIAKLVAKPMGDTSLVYYLNSSISRIKFLGSQMLTFIITLLIIFIFSILSGVLSKSIIVNDIDFEYSNFLKMNTTIILIFFLLGSVCFLINTFVNNNSEALAYSGLLIGMEYILDVFQKISSNLENLKYFTIFSVYNTDKIYHHDTFFISSSLIMLVAGIIFLILSFIQFNRRDLYL